MSLPLSAPWRQCISRTTKRPYYFNCDTQESTYTRPATLGSPAVAAAAAGPPSVDEVLAEEARAFKRTHEEDAASTVGAAMAPPLKRARQAQAGAAAASAAASASAAATAGDWIPERTHDGRPCWRNVRTAEISWSSPTGLSGVPTAPCCWEAVHTTGGVTFRNTVTAELITPAKTTVQRSERHRKDVASASAVVRDDQTALGTKLLRMSAKEVEQRRGHLGSTRSIFDRQKFWREYRLERRAEGSCLIQMRTGKVIRRLTAAEATVYVANPHLQQVFANGREYVELGRELGAADRAAAPDLQPRTKYSRRQGEVKTVEHWGQRKLLMSEIEFMVLHGGKARTVVYAGAAPGTHIGFLAELFPEHRWILVDPAAFDCGGSDKVEIRQTYFTDEMAAEFSGADTLFICDIRSMDAGQVDAETESRVSVDMEWQAKWVRQMRPRASMLKFRLPYTSGETEYLDGDILLPVWGGRTTTESRLIVTDPDSTRLFDHAEYEGFMFHFNTTTRTQHYAHDVEAPGIDHCFDCASEVHVLRGYLAGSAAGAAGAPDAAGLSAAVGTMTQRISRVCSKSGRSLVLE